MPGGGSIRVDAEQYARVRTAAREFSPLLSKELDKALRKAGKIGADAAKAKIRAMPSYGSHRSGHGTSRRPQGLRAKLAANIRVQLRPNDVRIVQSTIGVSGANARGLPRRLDAGGRFRHPVFGHDVYANQLGWRYFDTEIPRYRSQMEDDVADALDRAAAVIAGRL